MKEKGEAHFIDNILIHTWMDSKAAVSNTNCHPCALVKTTCQMKGLTEKVELPCQLPFMEYNLNMGAINDFDQLLSFLSVRLRCRKWWHTIFYFFGCSYGECAAPLEVTQSRGGE